MSILNEIRCLEKYHDYVSNSYGVQYRRYYQREREFTKKIKNYFPKIDLNFLKLHTFLPDVIIELIIGYYEICEVYELNFISKKKFIYLQQSTNFMLGLSLVMYIYFTSYVNDNFSSKPELNFFNSQTNINKYLKELTITTTSWIFYYDSDEKNSKS